MTLTLTLAGVAALFAACSSDPAPSSGDDEGGGGGGGGTGGTTMTTGSMSTGSTMTTGSMSTGSTMPTTSSSSSSSSGAGGGNCYAALGCDPLTPGSCDAAEGAGSACDLTQTGELACFPAPNTQMLGDACGNGMFCMHGLACGAGGTCVEFCCDQNDCTQGTCTPVNGAPGVSTCEG